MRNFGGRTAAYWKRMLTYPRASVRLLAQRALSRPDRAPAQGCISDLLRQLLQCPRPQVPALVRELARHGRDILPECLAAGRPCGPQTRRRLCQVFLQLGREAHGVEAMLAAWLPDPEAEAALLAMEHFGSPFLIEAMIASARPYPIWLDRSAVDRLSELALGSPVETVAVRALGGFGPDRRRAFPLLSYLARQGCETALESLLASGLPEAIDLLMELEVWGQARLAPDPRFDLWCESEDHLLQAIFRLPATDWNHSATVERLQQLGHHRSEAVRLAALRVLLSRAHPSWTPPLMRHRRAGVRVLAVAGLERPELEAALLDPHPRVRQKAARLLSLFGAWQLLLSHPDPVVRAGGDWAPPSAILGVLSQGVVSRELLGAARRAFPPLSYEYLILRLIPKAPAHQRRWLAEQLEEWESLTQLLDSPDLHTRRAAAARLIGRARPELIHWLEKETCWSVRTLLAEALSAWQRGGHCETEEVLRALQRPEVRVRKATLQPEIVLLRAWQDPDPELKARVAEELARRDILPEGTRATDGEAAADLLFHLEGPEHFAQLAAAGLDSPDPKTRHRLAERLGRLNRVELVGHDPELLSAALRCSPLALDWLARHGHKTAISDDLFQEILHKSNELEVLLQAPFLEGLQGQFPEIARILRRARAETRSPAQLLASPNPHIRCQAAGTLLLEQGLHDEHPGVRWRFARLALFQGLGERHLPQVLEHLEFHPDLLQPELEHVLALMDTPHSDLVTSRLTRLLAPHRHRPEVRQRLEWSLQRGPITRRVARRMIVLAPGSL